MAFLLKLTLDPGASYTPAYASTSLNMDSLSLAGELAHHPGFYLDVDG